MVLLKHNTDGDGVVVGEPETTVSSSFHFPASRLFFLGFEGDVSDTAVVVAFVSSTLKCLGLTTSKNIYVFIFTPPQRLFNFKQRLEVHNSDVSKQTALNLLFNQ